MTREEAIQILKNKKLEFTIPICREQKIATIEPIRSVSEHNEALDMAIEALNREQQIIENGYTGKEMRIRIGGKLFAVRELAQ